MENLGDVTKSLINSESGVINDSEKIDIKKIEEDFNKKEVQENTELKEVRDDATTIESNLSSKLNSEVETPEPIEVNDDATTIESNLSSKHNSEEEIPEPKPEWDDVLGSGCLMKKVLKAGTEHTKPQRLDICKLNYTCTLEDGTEVENVQNGTVQMGDLEVVQGIDLALALMNVGEKCALRIEGRLAYGSQGLNHIVPPDATVLYEVELLNVVPEEEMENYTISQRKKIGDKKKQRGNWWYGRGECTFAIQCYRRALDYLDEVEGGITEPKSENDDPIQRAMTDSALQELMEDRINVSNNMAAAQMKLGAYDAALQSLQIVLRCQPNNVKALYRKAKVLKAKNDVVDAMKYLQKAKDLEPDNTTIQKEIQELTTILKKHKNYEKELAKRMFNNSGDNKTQPKCDRTDPKTKSYMWASVALSVAVGIAGVVAWRFKFS